MKTDIQTQMNAEKPDDVLADLEAKRRFAAPPCYAAPQLIEIFAECQRNIDNAACGLKSADISFAVAQLRCALDKATTLQTELERHNSRIEHPK